MVIVAVDDDSLRAVGPWPWPRDVQARLIKAILDAHPTALGVDTVWTEADRRAGAAPADEALAAAVSGGPTAIGVGGSQVKTADEGDGPFATVVFRGPAIRLATLPSFAGAVRSVAIIDQAAPGHGVISNDPDPGGVFRHLRLLAAIDGRVAPDLSLDVYRLAMRAPYITVYTASGGEGVRGIGVGPSTFPTEADGALRIDYTRRDEWPLISAAKVLGGSISPQAFDHRLVLIGITATGQVDQLRATPVEPMSGIEINAQGLENLVVGGLAHRPSWAPVAEAALTLSLGVFLVAVLPKVRGFARWIAAAAPLLALAVFGILLWSRFRLITDVATPALGCGVVFVSLLGGGLAEVDAQRRRLRRDLELGRLAAARAEGELEAGRRIQMGILPTPAALAPDSRFDLDALMDPARQIGGDLYDFFKIDADHLYFAVGDVSGKGLPASLFMALGKSLCKSAALSGETDIGAIVRRANAEISRDNPEMLFITMFAGILDLESGLLSFCNAGHDSPFLLRAGAPTAAITGIGGPPLCVVEDFPYETETRLLECGDLLCVTTDGVTEAMTATGALIGRDAVERALATASAEASAHDITVGLRAAVAEFVAGAESSDDLTILTLRWRGPMARERPTSP